MRLRWKKAAGWAVMACYYTAMSPSCGAGAMGDASAGSGAAAAEWSDAAQSGARTERPSDKGKKADAAPVYLYPAQDLQRELPSRYGHERNHTGQNTDSASPFGTVRLPPPVRPTATLPESSLLLTSRATLPEPGAIWIPSAGSLAAHARNISGDPLARQTASNLETQTLPPVAASNNVPSASTGETAERAAIVPPSAQSVTFHGVSAARTSIAAGESVIGGGPSLSASPAKTPASLPAVASDAPGLSSAFQKAAIPQPRFAAAPFETLPIDSAFTAPAVTRPADFAPVAPPTIPSHTAATATLQPVPIATVATTPLVIGGGPALIRSPAPTTLARSADIATTAALSGTIKSLPPRSPLASPVITANASPVIQVQAKQSALADISTRADVRAGSAVPLAALSPAAGSPAMNAVPAMPLAVPANHDSVPVSGDPSVSMAPVVPPLDRQSGNASASLSPQSRAIVESLPPERPAPSRPIRPVTIEHARKNALENDVDVKEHQGVGISIKVKNNKANTNQMLEEAYDALIAGNQEEAIRLYKQVLQNQPDNKLALFGLATTYHRAGQVTLARPLYGRLLAIDPDNVEGLNNFLVLLGDESPVEALSELERLQRTHPNFSPVEAQMADIYAHMGDYPHAIADMNKALLLSPENLKYRYNMAVILDKAGEWDDAAIFYQQLLGAEERGEKLPAKTEEIQERLTFIRSNKPGKS